MPGSHLSAAFAERSYRPGDVAVLRVFDAPSRSLTVSLLGASQLSSPPVATRLVSLVGPPPWPVYIRLRATTSGVYVARLTTPGGTDAYAPLVLRPSQLGATRMLVVEPTNTWQAYNVDAGDSWYLNRSVTKVDLARPFAGDGLPPHFKDYDAGFLRWVAATGARADFVSDEDLSRFTSGHQLRRLYDVIVFPGHEEYVTEHVFDLVRSFRDLGGNLAFLSADSFYWQVTAHGDTMTGRRRFDDLGRHPAALVGAAYDGWEAHVYANRPYVVVGADRLPWLFAATGLTNGSSFGLYGIEIDKRDRYSPPNTVVAAEITNEFGSGRSAEMTYYRDGPAQVFDAGVMNFGGSASSWSASWTILRNLWTHLGGQFGS